MKESIILSLQTKGLTERITLENCISFVFSKDRYVPFSRLDAVFLCENEIRNVIDAEFSINSKLLHKGLIDSSEFHVSPDKKTIHIKSRGYTCALLNNEVEEGMYYNATPQMILDLAPGLINIDFETNEIQNGFIYLDSRSSVWTAFTYLGLYNYNSLPYISYANTVRFTLPDNKLSVTPSDDRIISYSSANDYSKIISAIHMKDTQDAYGTFDGTCDEAIARNIIRHKYIPFDRQWLSDPNMAFSSRFDYGMRYISSDTLTYLGFEGEDLADRFSVICNGVSKENMDISAFQITGNKGIIKTKLTSYHNPYTNNKSD